MKRYEFFGNLAVGQRFKASWSPVIHVKIQEEQGNRFMGAEFCTNAQSTDPFPRKTHVDPHVCVEVISA